MQTQPIASHFINGEYVEDTNGTPIEVIYPATGEVIATVYAATPEIVEKAITAARDAQAAWAAMTGTERGRILRRAADIMRERNHDLSILETYDTGKPYQETSVADATSGADALEYFGGLAASLTGSISSWAKTGSIPAANRWGSVLASAHGTIQRRSPAGKAHRRWPAGTRSSSNRPRRRRFAR